MFNQDETKSELEAGHPVYILMEEHKLLLEFGEKLKAIITEITETDLKEESEKQKHLEHLLQHLKESESHYLREENVLFPYIEKHGLTGPPKAMWMEHDLIRGIKKEIYGIYENRSQLGFETFLNQLKTKADELQQMLASHFDKENNVLFPASLRLIAEDEWKKIKIEFNEIGYCCFTPEEVIRTTETEAPEESPASTAEIQFETGSFSTHELETLLNSLPVDITFVDKNDEVRYFSQTKERIFVRTKAVLGRKVQNCHPEKSVHVVNQILEDFKSGKRDKAEFWINLNERLIYIRYFPVRDQEGNYLGCLEVTQDITDIKKIEGEKRLLD